MKVITIKQPWASLIVEGIKDVENRTWKTNFRGRVLVHAGLNQLKLNNIFTFEQLEILRMDKHNDVHDLMLDYDLPLGSIIGSVEIVDCVINHESIWAEKTEKCPFRTCEACDENKHRCIYYNKPIYNWVLANPIKFPVPIPAKGKLSFWEFEL